LFYLDINIGEHPNVYLKFTWKLTKMAAQGSIQGETAGLTDEQGRSEQPKESIPFIKIYK
jgi:hypothetical protein